MLVRRPTAVFRRELQPVRRGAFMMLAVFCLILTIGFVAFSVDIGMISLTRAKMQSSVDSAALAAAMEITHAVETAPPDETDITGYAKDAAAQKAADVAQLNGYFVDPDVDVVFGSRTFDESSGEFTVNWNIGSSDPTNIVKVTARKENGDFAQPDAKMRLFFAGIFGDNTASLRTEATAYVESRDIVVVHDFSRSMNFDSYWSDETATSPPDAAVLANLEQVWNDLQPFTMGTLGFTPQWYTASRTNPNLDLTFRNTHVDVTSQHAMTQVKLTFTDSNTQTINTSGTTGTYNGTSSNNGKNLSSVQVTVRVPSEVPQSAGVTQNGSPNVTFNFAADRKSVGVSASSNWNRVQLEFTDGVQQTISVTANSGTYSGTSGNAGKEIHRARVRYGSTWRSWVNSPTVTYQTVYNNQTYQFDDTNANVISRFALGTYPFPSGSWDEYVTFVRDNTKLNSKGYREKYGGLTFMQYVLRKRSSHSQTPQLAQAKHYPFYAIKRGHALLCDFLGNLGFNDYLGMVSYDTYQRVEMTQNEAGLPAVDISGEPLGTNYAAVNNLMAYKQAGHYYSSTNIGGGMREAIGLLEAHGRTGARPNILLMTDGNANVTNGPTDLPSGWESWFDGYDGEGTTYDIDFDSPSNSELSARMSLLHEVHEAVSKGYTVHTIAVGADADWRTMKAIAHYAQGETVWIQGGQTAEQMEQDLMDAFHRIAGLVPPAKLVGPEAP